MPSGASTTNLRWARAPACADCRSARADRPRQAGRTVDVIFWNTALDQTVTYHNALTTTPHLDVASLHARGGGTAIFVQQGDELRAAGESIGIDGLARFVHSGGTNTITGSGALSVGVWAGSHGGYEPSGTGALSADREVIGDQSLGTFMQSGGTNQVTSALTLGASGGGLGTYRGSGTYELSGSGSLVAEVEYVGSSGSGAITQTGEPTP